MRFHNAIRKEVLDYLAEKMPNIKNFYNGIPNILDIKNELPLVCVHLDDAQAEQHVLGGQQWEADLQIFIVVPFGESEPRLDEFASEIHEAMRFKDFQTIEQKYEQSYSYDYDEDKEWVSAVLSFKIIYNSEWINSIYLTNQVKEGENNV